MPVEGNLVVNENQRASSFSHANELAGPDYYGVKLNNGISGEITPTERGAYMRFKFTGNGNAYLVFDGYTGKANITIIPGKNELIGWVNNGFWFPGNFQAFFVIQFNQPFVGYGTWANGGQTITANDTTINGTAVGTYLQFAQGATVEAKMSSSYISQDQAALNLTTEFNGLADFNQTHNAAHKVWNNLLSRVAVEGNSEADKATFYSSMFRANLFSRIFYDIDATGKPYYMSPYDNKIHYGYMYSDGGFWDTFRSQFALDNILQPTMQGQRMQSLLDAQQQYLFFPSWTNPVESGVMIGNHAISVLADAWAKGIRNFDPNAALAAYLHEATNKGFWGGSNGRTDSKDYFTLGYIPNDVVTQESAAETMEYAYDDFCAYNLAKMTGNTTYINKFKGSIYTYKSVYDPSAGWMNGRNTDGTWVPNFDRTEWGGAFVEGNSWQYSWSVLHDMKGLVKLFGGEQTVAAKLDTFFTTKSNYNVGTYGYEIHEMAEMVLDSMGQYAIGNEPSFHISYLYNYVKQPWKTQQRTRMIMAKLFNSGPKGFPGDEDEGAESSWYVLSAMGLYSVTPGIDQLNISSPVFNKVTITLESGKTFTIIANNNSPTNVYIQSATLNGVPFTHNYIKNSDIMAGGTLVYQMGSTPNTNRGITDDDAPYSVSADAGSPVPPTITSASPLYAGAGSKVTIVGTHLDSASYIAFGGLPASSYKVISPDTVVAVVAGGGSGAIILQTPNGYDSVNGFVFAQGKPVTYGTADFDPQPGTTGLRYTSSDSTIATIVGNKVHTTGVGTTTITGTMGSTVVSTVLVVTKAPLTITPNNQYAIQGLALPKFTAKYTGFVNGDTTTNLTTLPTLSTTATSSSPAGYYQITASGAAANNYTFTYVPGTLTIIPQSLFTTPFPEKTYGDPDFYEFGTAINGAYASSNTNVATIANNGNIHITGAGTTSIKITRDSVSLSKILTIDKAPLTITANNESKIAGTANPALGITYTGFVYNDSPTSLTVQPTVMTTAVFSSPVGTYPITVGGATATNYNITYVPGVLTVSLDSTGVDPSVAVFPNPFTQSVNIKLNNGKVSGVTVAVTDLSGKTIFTKNYTNTGVINIDLSNYDKGVYIINLTQAGKRSSYKIIKN
jgi:predicted alpha-1,2-mannosidase